MLYTIRARIGGSFRIAGIGKLSDQNSEEYSWRITTRFNRGRYVFPFQSCGDDDIYAGGPSKYVNMEATDTDSAKTDTPVHTLQSPVRKTQNDREQFRRIRVGFGV